MLSHFRRNSNFLEYLEFAGSGFKFKLTTLTAFTIINTVLLVFLLLLLLLLLLLV